MSIGGMAKCKWCLRRSVYVIEDTDDDGRAYKQNRCECGYAGKKKYKGVK